MDQRRTYKFGKIVIAMLGTVEKIVRKAKIASRALALISAKSKSAALKQAAASLLRRQNEILKSNEKDLVGGRKKNLSTALMDRLTLNPKRVEEMAKALREIAALPDPVGEVVEEWKNADGMRIQKVRAPLGVIAMIYESRPNVTVESAALCLKAGNAVILRGGSEAIHSNAALSKIFSEAVTKSGIPENAVTMIPSADRKNIYDLCGLRGWVDLVIARGSEAMVQEIQRRSAVPVLGHGQGVCHVYVDRDADLKMAEAIAFNAKVQRPGVCNAMETLLVHRSVAKKFLPAIGNRYEKAGVVLKGDRESCKLLPGIKKASEQDWSTEYLDLMLSIRVVDSVDSAIEHINRYGSGHTDSIVTKKKNTAERFLRAVDSAAVFHNVSTRMHDGGVFGLGAEIGISTQKLHARGTMGIRELTTTKYIAFGSGDIRR